MRKRIENGLNFFSLGGGVVWMVLVGLMALHLAGCTAQQRKVAAVAVSSNPTATIQAEYPSLEANVNLATTVIQHHLDEVDLADRGALQIILGEVSHLQHTYEAALGDVETMKAWIAQGIKTYRATVPIVLGNQEIFSGEDLRILAEADTALREFADDTKAVTSAADLKRRLITLKRILEVAAVAL